MDEQSDRAKLEAELAEITQRQRELEAALGKPAAETAEPPPGAIDLGGGSVGSIANSGAIDADGDVIGKDKVGGDKITGVSAHGNEAVALAEKAVNIGGNVDGDVTTGDNNRRVEAEQYIEKYYAADPAQAVDINALRSQYLRRLLVAANALSLTGIDPKAASDREANLNLGAVYTALLTTRTEGMGQISKGLTGERGKKGGQLSALAQLDKYPYLVLLGDPGSGKSTFVNFVAMCLAGECLGRDDVNVQTLTAPLPDDEGEEQEDRQLWSHNALLPLPIILRDLAARGLPEPEETATAEHLWQFLEKESRTNGFVSYLRRELGKKGGLILLDGLDEVPKAHARRIQIKQLVEDLVATLPLARIVVTSRTYAYQKQEWALDGFQESVLAPFSDGQIRRFINRWYAHIARQRGLHETDAQGRAEQLKRAIFDSNRLKGLAERPLLLTLMSSLHAWRGGSLPQKREELYADTVDLLLEWWESQRVVRDEAGEVIVMQPSLVEWLKVDRDHVRELLHELAFNAHNNQSEMVGTADIPESALVTGLLGLKDDPDMKPARLIEFLSQRAGLIVPRGVKVYTFPHRTFQEYLAACYLTDNEYPDKVVKLVRTDPNRWREVALLAGAKAARGSASTIWLLIDALCYQEPTDAGDCLEDVWGAHLAGQALVEIANLQKVSVNNAPKVERVKRWLLHIMGGDQLPVTERAIAGVNLGILGDPRVEIMDADAMQFCFVPKGLFWMGSDEDNEFAKDADRPIHEVNITHPYWIGRHPVSNAQFQLFVDDGGYQEAAYWTEAEAHGWWKNGEVGGYTWIPEKKEWEQRWRNFPYDYDRPFNLPNHPVVGLNWYEALAYTRWLTQRWQRAGLLSKDWAVKLPSEAEWEKAAQGGIELPVAPIIRPMKASEILPAVTVTENIAVQKRFPWGDKMDAECANGEDADLNGTNALAIFPKGASPYGVMGLSGNVFEWTQSRWGSDVEPAYTYPYQQDDGREELDSKDIRVLRGGSVGLPETWLRCASRSRYYPNGYGLYNIGFRVCVSPFFTADR